MKKSIALNIFYTVGIIISVLGLKWAFQNHNYPIVALLAATTIFFFYLKIKIIKDVRQSIKDKTN
jgi:tetrahydromethanopterin S-methyltransferase subunit H